MPEPQQDPPLLDFPVPKRWRAFYRHLRTWLMDHRAIAGRGLIGSDAVFARGYLLEEDPAFAGGGAGGFRAGFALASLGGTIRVYLGMLTGGDGAILPTGFVVGDTTPLILSPGIPDGVICLGVTVGNSGDIHDGLPQSAVVQSFSSIPANSEPVFYLVLGTFATSGGSYVVTNEGGIGDQSFVLCGGLGGTPEFGPS